MERREGERGKEVRSRRREEEEGGKRRGKEGRKSRGWMSSS